MPARAKPSNESTVINMRIHTADVRLIDKAAKLEGKTRSLFLRDSAYREALKVLAAFQIKGKRCPLCKHTRK